MQTTNRLLFVIPQYDPSARMIVVDVEKPLNNRDIDLPTMAYYMEKDVCSVYS